MVMTSRAIIFPWLFALSMLLVGTLRYAGTTDSILTSFSGYATPLYVVFTVVFIVLYRRAGVSFQNLGFNCGLRWQHVGLAILAVVVLQAFAYFSAPVLEEVLGRGRDLSRFSGVHGSLQGLVSALALSWTFAAFGEEIAFRIMLLGGLITALGRERGMLILAVVIQAVVFGLVHLYQGPAGVAGATFSGLAFGVITVVARGAIWPAALAHGLNNSIGLISLYLGAG